MMNNREIKRKTKKFIIASFPFILFLFLIIIVYLLTKPAPSCFDQKRNQGEEGIDCGGPCLPCYIKYAKEPEILSTQVLPVTQEFSEVLIKIKNENEKVGAKFNYRVRFFDRFAQLIGEEEGKSFVLPLSVKYLVLPKVNLKSQEIFRVDFSFTKLEWQEFPYPSSELFSVLNKKLRWLSPKEPGVLELSGELQNETSLIFSRAEIVILLYSRTGEILNAARTEMENLKAGERRSFKYVWLINFLNSHLLDPDRIEVFVDSIE